MYSGSLWLLLFYDMFCDQVFSVFQSENDYFSISIQVNNFFFLYIYLDEQTIWLLTTFYCYIWGKCSIFSIDTSVQLDDEEKKKKKTHDGKLWK